MDKRNQRRGGFYWVGDKPYLSVTKILEIKDKPALRFWFGREIYYAMVKDPTLTEQEAMRYPYNKGVKAKDRGVTVHGFVESHKKGDGPEKMLTSVDPAFHKYCHAFNKWALDDKVVFLDNEKTIINHENKYAGTCDLVCQLNGRPETWLLDIKTGKDIYNEVELQLSAYKLGLAEEGKQIDRIGVVLLETGQDDKPTGNYIFAEKKYVPEVFLAAKTLWEWDHQDILSKVNYYG